MSPEKSKPFEKELNHILPQQQQLTAISELSTQTLPIEPVHTEFSVTSPLQVSYPHSPLTQQPTQGIFMDYSVLSSLTIPDSCSSHLPPPLLPPSFPEKMPSDIGAFPLADLANLDATIPINDDFVNQAPVTINNNVECVETEQVIEPPTNLDRERKARVEKNNRKEIEKSVSSRSVNVARYTDIVNTDNVNNLEEVPTSGVSPPVSLSPINLSHNPLYQSYANNHYIYPTRLQSPNRHLFGSSRMNSALAILRDAFNAECRGENRFMPYVPRHLQRRRIITTTDTTPIDLTCELEGEDENSPIIIDEDDDEVAEISKKEHYKGENNNKETIKTQENEGKNGSNIQKKADDTKGSQTQGQGNALASSMECPICLAPMRKMTSTICGHVFCLRCIRSSIKSTAQCPLCRVPLRFRDIHPIFL